MTTVREAAKHLSNLCDGANALDGQGFNRLDSHFVKSLLDRSRWTPKMEKAVQRTLTKYKGQLSHAGIEHSELIRETKDDVSVSFGKQVMELNSDDKGRLLLKARYDFKEQAKAIPNHKWMPEIKMWRYLPKLKVYIGLLPYLTSEDIVVANSATRKILDKLDEEWREEQKRLVSHDKNVAAAIEVKKAEDIEVDVPLKTTPMFHQKKAFAIGTMLDASAFLMEQGTGKTLSAIAVAGHRHLQGQVDRLLVVAPLSVVPVWLEEFRKHAKFNYACVALSTRDLKNNSIQELIGVRPGLLVVVINYEALWRVEPQVKKWGPQMAILDESQRIKNGTTNQSKSAHRLGKLCKYKLILTGTPITESPLDWYSQYKFLNMDIFGDTSFTNFRDKYAIMGGYGGHEILGYRDLSELTTKAHSIAYRVTKKEALDLPPTTDQILYCRLNESAKVYNDMKKKLVASIKNKDLSAPLMITKILRLQQIAGGYFPIQDSTGETIRMEPVGTEKLKLLEEFMEDFPHDKKLVIFARFTPEINAIWRMLKKKGRNASTLTGDTPRDRRGDLVRDFQEGDLSDLIIQIQTGGLGITLTAADTAVFYSTSFSSADYEQAKARIHRIGQKQPVTYIHLIAQGTIDEEVLVALREKKNVADLVVDKLNPLKGVKMSTDSKSTTEDVKKVVEELDKELTAKNPKASQPKESKVETSKKVVKKAVKGATKKVVAMKSKPKPVSKAPDADLVSLADIAEEYKVNTFSLRKALRDSKLKKPGGSWRWPKNHPDLKTVRGMAKGLEE